MKNQKAKIFDYEVYVGSKADLKEEVKSTINSDDIMTILSMNTLKLYLGERDHEYKDSLKTFTHIIQDGQSMVFANKLVNKINSDSISGAELMVDLIGLAAKENYRIFFLGSPEELINRVGEKIKHDYPELYPNTAYQHGYYDRKDEAAVVDKIAQFNPDFLFIAFGSPRKEEFIINYKDKLKTSILMGVGGSYEYFVGDVKLDSFTKKLGLRWFVRTLHDPIRLGSRYAKCNSYFAKALFREMRNKRPQVSHS